MAGLLDIFQNVFTGGGVLGQQQPPGTTLVGNNPQGYDAYAQAAPQPTGIDPNIFLHQYMRAQNPQGPLGRLRGALNQIADPSGAQHQQLLQNYIALKQLEEKPTNFPAENAAGEKGIGVLPPWGKGDPKYYFPSGSQPQGGAAQPGMQAPPGVVNLKEYNKDMASAAAKNQQAAVDDAKAAAKLEPYLKKAAEAYAKVNQLGGIGPFSGSSWFGRPLDSYLGSLANFGPNTPGGKDSAREAARQEYESAVNYIKATVTAAMNKGEGAVSNYERMLYAALFPQLTAQDFASQQPFWEKMAADTSQAISAGKMSPLSQTPAVSGVLDRAPIGSAPNVPAPGQPIRIGTQEQYNLLPAGARYIAPDGSMRTKGGQR